MSGQNPNAVVTAPSLVELRTQLDNIRFYQHAKTGQWKDSSLPKNMLHREIQRIVLEGLRARGFFFFATYPYYFDRVEGKLIRLTPGDDKFTALLRALGFYAAEQDTKVLLTNLIDKMMSAPVFPIHRFSYMTEDGSAVYIRATEVTMYKVTADDIISVPLGTDGVLLVADDLGDWPTLEELKPHMDELRALIGNACTRIVPGSPLTRLTSRWDESQYMTAQQQWQMAFTRLMFPFCASLYRLWPILLLTGESGSGKSTLPELFQSLMQGVLSEVKGLPADRRALLAHLTKHTFGLFDNVDRAGLDDQKSVINDIVCHMSTGASYSVAELYKTNAELEFVIRLHPVFSSVVCPFVAADVLRRTLELSMAPKSGKKKNKNTLIKNVLTARPAMLAEMLLRTQNMVKAHLACSTNYEEYEAISNTDDYEVFTLVCAEYEGSLTETRQLWKDYMKRNRETTSERDPLVSAVRLWLGKGGNAGREVTATTLFAEIQTIFEHLQQPMTYKTVGSFSTRMGAHQEALKILGMESKRIPGTGARVKVFNPSPEEMAECERRYNDLKDVIDRRPTTFTPSPEYKRILYRDADRADKQQAGEDSMYPALDDYDDAPKKEVIN